MTEFSLLCGQHIALFHGLSTPFSTFVGIILSHLPGFELILKYAKGGGVAFAPLLRWVIVM